MKLQLLIASIILAAGALLTGCCTGGHPKQWEYKTAYPPPHTPKQTQVVDSFLNGLAKEGWVLVQREPEGSYIFKRPKK